MYAAAVCAKVQHWYKNNASICQPLRECAATIPHTLLPRRRYLERARRHNQSQNNNGDNMENTVNESVLLKEQRGEWTNIHR